MKRFLTILGAAAILSASAAPVFGVTLADLLAGGSITVGDKTFDNFTNGNIVCGDDSCSGSFATITVTGGTFGGLLGLSFTGNIGLGPNSSLDIFFEYDVTATCVCITDVHMDMNGTILPPGGDFFVSIQEEVLDGNVTVGSIAVLDSPINFKSASADLIGGPYSTLHVTKDILLLTGDVEGASLSNFKQTWSQTTDVPEPASMMLLGTVFVGLAFVTRRRMGKKVNG